MSGIFPIREISSYNRKWKIKARVTSKSELRSYSRNGQSSGVFSVDLLDAEEGEIRCSFFGEACNKFYDIIESGKVYTLSNGQVKVANKKYNNLNHNYEINFADANSAITQVDEDVKIKSMIWNIQSIRSLMNKEPPYTADICGTVHKFESAGSITTKSEGRQVSKRVVSVADSSGCSVDVTLWGELAEMPDSTFQGNPAVALKAVGIREYGVRTGSLSNKASYVTDVENAEIKKQSDWWKASGSVAELTNLTQVNSGGVGGGKTPWATLAEIQMEARDQVFLSGNDSKYYNVFCRLANLRSSDREGKQQLPYYNSCTKCKRKLDGAGYCVEHGQVEGTPLFMFSAAFSDRSDHQWLSCFDDVGKIVFGTGADKVKTDVESMEPEKYASYIRGHTLQQLLKVTVRVKPDEYQGERRAKFSAVRADVVNSDAVTDFLYSELIAVAVSNGDTIFDPTRAMAMAQ